MTNEHSRLPPFSEEAERAVIGSVLVDVERCIDLCFERGINGSWFYVPSHRMVWAKLEQMNTEDKKIDLLTVGESLKESGALDQVGGYAFLEGLIDSTPTSAHCQHYLEIIEEKFKLRKIITNSAETIDLCFSAEKTPDEIIATASFALGGIGERQKDVDTEEAMAQNKRVLNDAFRGITSGIELPWRQFSENTGGVQRASVVPLLGRDGKGKSGALAQIVDFWIGKPVPVPTLSFSFEDVARRMLLRMAGCREWFSAISAETARIRMVDGNHKMVDYDLSQYEAKMDKYIEFLKGKPFWIIEDRMTVEDICRKIESYSRKHKIEAVTIDGFKDILHSKGDGQTEAERHISIQLQAVAKRTGVSIIAVSHIHKVDDGKAISKMNVMGSSVQFQGARQFLIFQDAGIVGIDGVNTFALDCTKSNFTHGGMALLKRDQSVLHYTEVTL